MSSMRRFFKMTSLKKAATGTRRNLLRVQDHVVHRVRRGTVAHGNRVTVFPDNDTALENMWSSIQAAKHFIVMETYSVEADFVGERTLVTLINAMKRGVRVTLIFDDVGSPDLTWNMLMQELLALGADIISFNPIDANTVRRRFNPFLRNHRKLLVIDDEVGYCGSINLSAEYASIEKGGSGVFRDVHLRIHGGSVVDLLAVMGSVARQNATNRLFGVSSASILATQEYLSDERLELARNPRRARPHGKARLQILEENSLVRKRSIQNAMFTAIRQARERIFISTPYFIPPPRLRRALVRAAKLGVDVRVLTTGESDVPGTVWAGKYVMGVMLRHGVRVYELSPEHYLHAKLFTADGNYSTVGSFNFDFLSTHRNLEVVVATHDDTFAADVEQHFVSLTRSARRVKRNELSTRTVPERVLHWFAYQFAKLWRRFNFFEERQ